MSAPDCNASCQLADASCGEPVKKTNLAPEKLSGSIGLKNAGSPPASVRVPAGRVVSSRISSLAAKLPSSISCFNSFPRNEEAPTMAMRGVVFSRDILSWIRGSSVPQLAQNFQDDSVENVDGGDGEQGCFRVAENRGDNQRHGHNGERSALASPVHAFEIVVANFAGHQKSQKQDQQRPDE